MAFAARFFVPKAPMETPYRFIVACLSGWRGISKTDA
jgi:hypothetical protein